MDKVKITADMMNQFSCSGDCASCSSNACGSKPKPAFATDGCSCGGDCSSCSGNCGGADGASSCSGSCSSCTSKCGAKAPADSNVCPTCGQLLKPIEKRHLPTNLETGDDMAVRDSKHLVCWPADLMHADADSAAFAGATLYIVSVSALAAMGSVAAIAKGNPMLLAAVYPETEEALREKLAEVFEKNEVAKAVVVRTNLKFDTGIVSVFNFAVDEVGLACLADLEEIVVTPAGNVESVQEL
ncbi:hypothetical protein J8273_6653 [Carpediemonas membranifera]|uniref:Uncharacterized protein n=1 Tax=Carpediemonas membranifera TaxID=201153 RepID=A0A8J6E2M0_9EUKA|nr:hypothetical protein J8273_6653 [Carpediemonas membranifera]|eukprot:KAG9392062.1 hypothetical protein J8273_6653 [Carpediemonas membranifera]